MASNEKYFLSGVLHENCEGLTFNHAKMFSRVLDGLKGKELMITVERLYNKRSSNQNRYLHGVIVPYLQNWFKDTQGESLSTEQVKAHLYKNVLGHKIVFKEILGHEVITIEGKRFSQMNTKEFNEAKDKVQKHFIELDPDCAIPDPRGRSLLNDYIG
jgi:hypothetical protein